MNKPQEKKLAELEVVVKLATNEGIAAYIHDAMSIHQFLKDMSMLWLGYQTEIQRIEKGEVSL